MDEYVDVARHQWAEGNRRLSEQASDRDAYEALMDQVDAVTEELRRRVGEHFTLAQLADAYDGADDWVLQTVAERGAVRSVSVVQDAAFHLYARAARDYSP